MDGSSNCQHPVFDSFIQFLIVLGIPVGILLLWVLRFVARSQKTLRRPFDEMPRPAGWSLQQRTSDLMDSAMFNFMIAVTFGMTMWALAQGKVGSPSIYLTVGIIINSYFLIRCARTLLRVRNYRLGLFGEQVVGHILDGLSSESIRVFHDMEVRDPGGKPWNIDHIVVAPGGVFCIETKTRRKPIQDAADGQKGHQLIYDGHQIIFPKPMQPDRHGLDQAERNAQWLGEKLKSWNGCPVPVTPILVFPGWWVDAKARGPVVVLNPKGLVSFISNRSECLSEERQRAIAGQLEERCRIDLSRD